MTMRAMMRKVSTTLLLGTIALSACKEEAVSPPADASPAAATEPAPAASAARSDEAREVTLTSTGIVLVNAIEGRGAATPLDFGMPRGRVMAALGDELGTPELTSNAECGAGPMQFADVGALTLNFLDGKLVGWLAEPADNLVTADGVRMGTPLAGLGAERQVQMIEGTLEGEFSYVAGDGGTIGGFVDGAGEIASLNAGAQCFFR